MVRAGRSFAVSLYALHCPEGSERHDRRGGLVATGERAIHCGQTFVCVHYSRTGQGTCARVQRVTALCVCVHDSGVQRW